MEHRWNRALTILSAILAAALGVVSYCGAFVPATYERDAASMAAQGIGQDMVNLFVVVPLLIISLIWMRRGGRITSFIFGGTLFYILYSFVIYAFGVHFNRLFLLYCLILGLSFYLFVIFLHQLGRSDVGSWFGPGTPVRPLGIFMIAVAAIFYLLWFKDTVPAILQNTVPSTVSDYGLLVNPVHVIDMAIALPGLLITAILLMKKHRLGYILTPVLMVFVIILAVALAAMVVVLKLKNISEDASIAATFVVLAGISGLFLVLFLKNLAPHKQQP
jgi:hypothetical protein